MADIKLFVCCHQPVMVPEHPLLIPVQVGAACSEMRFPNFLQDDIGCNISHKNRSYCELTAQYWAWKNIDADYYGLFHYRRYLCPRPYKAPYYIARLPTLSTLEKLSFQKFQNLIPQYDVILPQRENMYVSVRLHYEQAKYHYKEDLKLAEEIVLELYPEYSRALEEYLSGTICYFGNIFIMKRLIFSEYCSWLFSILDIFDKRTNVFRFHAQEQRVDGYLAERLLGVYVEHLRANSKVRIAELPRVHFVPDRTAFYKEKVKNFLVPPGTHRRAFLKNCLFDLQSCLGDSDGC